MGATKVTLRILGSGDPFGSGGRNQSGYFVEAGSRRILLDCGASAAAALKRHEADTAGVGLVLLTHFHGDHVAGLPFLYHDYQHVTTRRWPLVVAGPAGVRGRVERICRTLYPGSAKARRRFRVRYRVLSAGRAFRPPGMAGVRVVPFRVRHSVPGSSLGYRVEIAGRRLVYTGDTGWFPALPRATRGAHLLLCECTYLNKVSAEHLCLSELRAHRRCLGARRILLTHLGPDLADLRSVPGFRLARDGMIVRV